MRRHAEDEQDLPEDVQRNIAPNGLRIVFAQGLQSSGDQTVNASTVLPWLFATLGVPAALAGLLVPIRESGSMLPQALLTPLVLRVRYRKWIVVTGAFVQSTAVAIMAAAAAFDEGLSAGLTIIAALAVFSFGRCLTSIASKDVQGRTIPKGQRGQINGLATTAAGLVAITLGLAIRYFGGEDVSARYLAWLLAAGAMLWTVMAVVYAQIREVPDVEEPVSASTEEPMSSATNWFKHIGVLLRDDTLFRHFVLVRSLLLVSALSPPFVVMLSIQSGAGSLAGIGGFIIASGLAALLGGRIFGRFADRSSQRLMSIGAGIASAILIATVAITWLPDFRGEGGLVNLMFIAVYFLLTLTHTGVRVGRKTYIIDMAEGDQRTTYVAVSNSAMGFILLIVGSVTSAIAALNIPFALLFLAAMGLIGVFAGARLPDVSVSEEPSAKRHPSE